MSGQIPTIFSKSGSSLPILENTPLEGLGGGPESWTSPEGLSSSLQVLLLLTVLSLAPAVLLMTTCYVRIIIVLGLLRQSYWTAVATSKPSDDKHCAFHDLIRDGRLCGRVFTTMRSSRIRIPRYP